jgi:hypothetical protein
MPFGWTITPDLFYRVFHGCPIFLQLPNKSAHRLDPRRFRSLYPALQAGHFATIQNAAKAQHQMTHGGEVRGPLQITRWLCAPTAIFSRPFGPRPRSGGRLSGGLEQRQDSNLFHTQAQKQRISIRSVFSSFVVPAPGMIDYPSDGDASIVAGIPAHRLDEFPVGYSSASCTPALLASALPTGSDYKVVLLVHRFSPSGEQYLN